MEVVGGNPEQSYVGQYALHKVNGPIACFMSTFESYMDQDDRWQWGGVGVEIWSSVM